MLLMMFYCTEVHITKEGREASRTNHFLPKRFLACVMLECFVNFLDDLYYEPLPWFMILYMYNMYNNIIDFVIRINCTCV